jgi:hypothetical protein
VSGSDAGRESGDNVVPHETAPSESTTERISVAFDAGEPAALYY